MAINPLPSQFRGRYPNSAIASYDWYDTFQGVAYKEFLGLNVLQDDTQVYIFTDNSSVYGHSLGYTAYNNAAGDLDFDLTIGKVTTLAIGDIYYSIPISFCNNLDSTQTLSTTLTANIYKVVGGVETPLGPENAGALSAVCLAVSTSGNVQQRIFAGKVSLSSKMVLVPGDIIRISIQTTSAGASKLVCIMHDPASRGIIVDGIYSNESVSTGKLRLMLPVSLDL